MDSSKVLINHGYQSVLFIRRILWGATTTILTPIVYYTTRRWMILHHFRKLFSFAISEEACNWVGRESANEKHEKKSEQTTQVLHHWTTCWLSPTNQKLGFFHQCAYRRTKFSPYIIYISSARSSNITSPVTNDISLLLTLVFMPWWHLRSSDHKNFRAHFCINPHFRCSFVFCSQWVYIT